MKVKIMKGFRSGAALITVLVLTGVSMIALGGVLSYVSNASRMTAYYENKNVCRLAAQSEIEIAKAAINRQFRLSINRAAVIVGGNAAGLVAVNSYDWFDAYTGAPKRNIGKVVGTVDATLRLEESSTNNDCVVKVRIARVDHSPGDQWAEVTLVAEATRAARGGADTKVVLSETIRFAQQRSQVFNNAYFVNNYGWFEGGSSTFVNGDIRSNGDMQLDNEVIVNGDIYAAQNPNLGVNGVQGLIFGDSGSQTYGSMHDRNKYLNDSTHYGTSNRARPLHKDPKTDEINPGGYSAPTDANKDAKLARLHPEQEFSVEMPYIGDISSSQSEYRAWAQELHDKDPNMSTIKQGGKTLVSVYYDGVGPSGQQYFYDASGNQHQAADYGAIVLEGTASQPIEINGPVIIPSDVIIKGYVTGQGTIYSGRNIHIVGDIKYKNPPTWSGKSSLGTNGTNETANASKDLLGLMAKGNIVLGNYKNWVDDLDTIMTSSHYVPAYDCDTSDAAIGYPQKFNDTTSSSRVHYKSKEKVSSSYFALCEQAGLADFVPGGRDSSTGQFGKNRGETVMVAVGEKTVEKTGYYDYYDPKTKTMKNKKFNAGSKITEYEERPKVSYDRKYYESVCDDAVIASMTERAQQSVFVGYDRWGRAVYQNQIGDVLITQIDAVLYDNHTICGRIGQCSFNGALVCRNEAIQYSGGLYLNWDMRLFSGSNQAVNNNVLGLPGGPAPAVVVDWRELPEGVVSFD